ncbi:BPG-independent [Trichophaea hybrida]|nr:BPG-independent [Trichophaea hybrida]
MVAQKAALIVIDGWGIASSPNQPGDAVSAADTPVMDSFRAAAGYTELEASSLAVGLPEGLMGNSEVGHLNIGAGRVVWQDVVRIDQTAKEGKFLSTPNLKASLQHAKDTNGRLHLLGLVSDGGVHSKNEHLYELLRSAKTLEIPNVYIHFFGDGRDTDPKSSARYMQELLDKIKELGMEGVAKIATVVGRYYAMDRDKRWERVQVALKGLVNGEGEATVNPVGKIHEKYEQGETDEFFKPIIVNGSESRLQDNDTLFFFNYRADRVREITLLLGVDSSYLPDPSFTLPKNLHITTMTQYKTEYPFHIAFPPQRMDDVLAEWLAKQGLKQCHIAETEKYAHVTFFFNGGVEKQFENEIRDMIASPRVATYDLEPPMSALKVAKKMAERLCEGEYEFVMNNFAPPDMVGHTGVYSAAVQAVTATDEAIGVVYEACKKHGYVLFVTSDHGNAEEMLNEEGTPKTSHTLNKVPFVMANAPEGWGLVKDGGVLGDVAPTVLEVMGLPQPQDMTGRSLLVKA